MAEFWIPDAEEFAKWSDDSRPVAVVRITCSLGHPITEWWRTGNGREHPWGGRMTRGADDEGRIVGNRPVGYPGTPVNPERAGDRYWRTDLVCPVPGCDDRKTLTPEGSAPVTRLLDALLAGEVPEEHRFAHPSGAPAIVVNVENLFGYRRV